VGQLREQHEATESYNIERKRILQKSNTKGDMLSTKYKKEEITY